ncbi:hypothetical protein BaRGS_00003226 [Batillaria attramentaria]|uniref:Uncharacterized protein n=1 Tax=Batillaria attramentaria TaxID=370345 RepID=A0ABD0M168_9CAEN
MTSKTPALSVVVAELASWILAWKEEDESETTQSLSVRIKAVSQDEDTHLLCHLKEGQLDKLKALVLHVQCVSEEHHFVVVTCKPSGEPGERAVVSGVCVKLTPGEHGLQVHTAEMDLRASGDRDDAPGTHIHLRVRLSFVMKVDGQASRSNFKRKASLTSTVYVGCGDRPIVGQRDLQFQCLACFASSGQSSGRQRDKGGTGTVRFYSPCGIPLVTDLGIGIGVEPLAVVDWRKFGFIGKPEGDSSAAQGNLVADDLSRLPSWARSGNFVLLLAFLVSFTDTSVCGREYLERIRELHMGVSDKAVSDAADESLRDLFREADTDVHRAENSLDVFIPIISESLATIFTRSVSPSFRAAVQKHFKVSNGKALELDLRHSLWNLLDSGNPSRPANQTRPENRMPSTPQVDSAVDEWEGDDGSAAGTEGDPATSAPVTEHLSDFGEDEAWFSQMELELADHFP